MENFSPIFFSFWRDGIWPVHSLSNTVDCSTLDKRNISTTRWCKQSGSRPWHKAGEGGGGAGHPEPEIREGRSPKQLFRPFGPQFGLKIRGLGEGVGRSYGSATGCKKGTLESRLQQTWICTGWPSFLLPLPLITSTKKIDLAVNWSHRNVFLLLSTKDRSQISVATTATRTEGCWPVVWLIA